jgi:hypothetical protein
LLILILAKKGFWKLLYCGFANVKLSSDDFVTNQIFHGFCPEKNKTNLSTN